MNVLDLFSGIGGFSLGLERAGMRTVAFCEIEEFCRGILRQHWPNVPCYEDVRRLTAARLADDRIAIDIICGGFPCQDISRAGSGRGIDGERSGLWSEFARLIDELRPRYALLENSADLLGRGMGRVLGDLAAIGYDAKWDCIPACAVGAPHRRDRVWIVAYPRQAGMARCLARLNLSEFGSWQFSRGADLRLIAGSPFESGNRWPKPLIRRMDDGIPRRLDRIRALGNAVIPQIPEIIGRALMSCSP